MERWIGKVALVTGASAGIGYAVAKTLVQNGMKVLGIARNTDKIQALASELSGSPGKLYSMKCDVRIEAEINDVFAFAKKELGGVDVCINNAGLGHNAPLLSPDSATAQWKDMLDVNVLAVCVINREYMKQMKERKVDDGQIILINSMSGHRVTNYSDLHFYSATKFCLTGLCHGLRFELKNMKSNIRISQISPGLVRTEFRQRYLHEDEDKAAKFYDNAHYNGSVAEAEDIASSVVFVLSTPQRAEVNDVFIRSTGQPI